MRESPENWVIDIDNANLLFKPILVNKYADKSLNMLINHCFPLEELDCLCLEVY